jgi:sigma-E factor negative regulatory protein RseA
MNDNDFCKLSAFIDNELSDSQAAVFAGRLLENDELRTTWERYHLISDAIRNELTCQPNAVCQRVRETLDTEPTILAPKRMPRSVLRPAAGLAIAASVAAIAIIAWQPGDEQEPAGQPLAVIETPVQPAATVQFVSGEVRSTMPTAPRLNGYIVNHHERTANLGMQGVTPYVQLVDYAAEQ